MHYCWTLRTFLKSFIQAAGHLATMFIKPFLNLNRLLCVVKVTKYSETCKTLRCSWGILDRNDYIDKVERNLNDGSFDILGSDPSLSYYHIVKDWGDKWLGKGEITQPLVDCILNVNARPGKNYGLIKTHKPNNPIRLITSGNGTAVENLSLFTEYFLHPCVKKEPQILIDTTALLNKVTEINNKFSPFPAGTLLVSWVVISMYPSIDNKVGLAACKEALDRREHTSP